MFRNKIELVQQRDSYLQADCNQQLPLHRKNPICFLKINPVVMYMDTEKNIIPFILGFKN